MAKRCLIILSSVATAQTEKWPVASGRKKKNICLDSTISKPISCVWPLSDRISSQLFHNPYQYLVLTWGFSSEEVKMLCRHYSPNVHSWLRRASFISSVLLNSLLHWWYNCLRCSNITAEAQMGLLNPKFWLSRSGLFSLFTANISA